MKTPPLNADLILADHNTICEMLSISRALLYAEISNGSFGLLPMRFGTSTKKLYSVAELKSWVAVGMPPRHEWQNREGA